MPKYEPKKKPKPDAYQGVLTKPIIFYPDVLDEDGDQCSHPKMDTQRAERIDALYAHYKIDKKQKGAELELAIALANNHIKGFKIKYRHDDFKTGPKAKWFGAEGFQLFFDVHKVIRENPSFSERHVIYQYLVKDMKSRWYKKKPAPLYTRYKEIKKALGVERYKILRDRLQQSNYYDRIYLLLSKQIMRDDGKSALLSWDSFYKFLGLDIPVQTIK